MSRRTMSVSGSKRIGIPTQKAWQLEACLVAAPSSVRREVASLPFRTFRMCRNPRGDHGSLLQLGATRKGVQMHRFISMRQISPVLTKRSLTTMTYQKMTPKAAMMIRFILQYLLVVFVSLWMNLTTIFRRLRQRSKSRRTLCTRQ